MVPRAQIQSQTQYAWKNIYSAMIDMKLMPFTAWKGVKYVYIYICMCECILSSRIFIWRFCHKYRLCQRPVLGGGQCPKLLVTIFRNLVKFGDYISKIGQINFNPVTKYSQILTIFRNLVK